MASPNSNTWYRVTSKSNPSNALSEGGLTPTGGSVALAAFSSDNTGQQWQFFPVSDGSGSIFYLLRPRALDSSYLMSAFSICQGCGIMPNIPADNNFAISAAMWTWTEWEDGSDTFYLYNAGNGTDNVLGLTTPSDTSNFEALSLGSPDGGDASQHWYLESIAQIDDESYSMIPPTFPSQITADVAVAVARPAPTPSVEPTSHASVETSVADQPTSTAPTLASHTSSQPTTSLIPSSSPSTSNQPTTTTDSNTSVLFFSTTANSISTSSSQTITSISGLPSTTDGTPRLNSTQPASSSNNAGLSTGAQVGIAVAVTIVTLVSLLVAWVLVRRYRRRKAVKRGAVLDMSEPKFMYTDSSHYHGGGPAELDAGALPVELSGSPK